MTEAGGPVTQAGIRYQDQVAALYLGRLIDPRERPRNDHPVEVRLEAPKDVDDSHRVASSNRRLLAFDETGVTFRYKDYRRSGADRQQVMMLGVDEFIRRFLLHVLPRRVPPHSPLRPARQFGAQGQPYPCPQTTRRCAATR